MNSNITEHQFNLKKNDYEKLTHTKGQVFWLFGLSGSGKSSIANELALLATKQGKLCKIIDGDTLRQGVNRDLSFSQKDRNENLRRAAEMAKQFSQIGVLTICCFITPLKSQREMIQKILKDEVKFIFISTSLEVCENRDPKGLYKKARKNEIQDFTGVQSPFEVPDSEDCKLSLDTNDLTIKEASDKILSFLGC